MDYAFIFNILAAIGGTTGIVNLIQWIKSKKAKVKIQFSTGDFYFLQGDLIVHFKTQLTNERDEAVYITDIIAFIAEDPSKTKDKKGHMFIGNPTSSVFSPTKLEAKGTIDLDYEINFSNIDVHPIDRIGLTHFAGFMKGDVPVIIANESDFDEKWDDLPIEMKLFIHINGKEVIDTILAVHPKGTEKGNSHGTLDFFQIAKIQRNYAKLKKDKYLERIKKN